MPMRIAYGLSLGSKLKRTVFLCFSLIAIIASGSIPIDTFNSSASAAPTQQACYDAFNNQKSWIYSLKLTSEQNLYNSCKTYCTSKVAAAGLNFGVDITCKNPSQLSTSASGNAADAEMAPARERVCGKPGSRDDYAACVSLFNTNYSSCNTTGGSITSAMSDTPANVARCLARKYPNIPASDFTPLIEQGRGAASNITDAAITTAQNEVKIQECAAMNPPKTYDEASKKCVDKATEEGKTTCAVDGIGWIICPVMTFLGGVMDAIQSFLADHFLSTNPKLVKADPSNGTFQAWGIFRNYANLAFIGVFLFIIYSQMTGAGLSNYGLKRMLPRLIVAAILVNLSFYICMVAVDLSNILGYGVKGIFDGVTTAAAGTSGSTPSWATAIAGVLITGLGVALALAAGIILPALIAALMIVLILVAREALIVLLIVISPLAFVAYLLPNTEKFFQKWMSAFWKLLMVFPIVAAVFGVSTMTSRILYNTGQTELQIIALGVTVIPFFVVPALLKGATAAVGAVGSRMQGWGNKATGRIGAKSKESYLGRQMAERKKLTAARNAQIAGGTYSGKYGKWNPRNLRSAASGVVNRSRYSGKAGDRMATMGQALEDKEFSEEVSAAGVGYSTQSSGAVLGQLIDKKTGQVSPDLTDAQKAAAIEHVMRSGSFSERKALVEASGQMDDKLRKRVSDGVYSKGDQNIFGSDIGAHIANGTIGTTKNSAGNTVSGSDWLREKTRKNIEDGHVGADHLVQGEGSAQYMVDVAKGQRQMVDANGKGIENPDGSRVMERSTVGGSTAAVDALRDTASQARANSGTQTKANAGAMSAELGRL
jgi:hypothetical protein